MKRKFDTFVIRVFLIKQHFEKSEMKFVDKTIKLQKRQNWIKTIKLILNSSLAFNSKMRRNAGKSWVYTKS